MNLVRYNPFSLLRSSWPFEDEEDGLSSWSTGTGNNLEISEEDDKIVVRANVAGVDADDIEVNLHEGRLWIRAQAKEEEKDKKTKTYKTMSRSYSYVVDLPNTGVSEDAKTAEVEKGILTLTFEKTPEVKPKKISIKAK